jgi:hypothetical protein
MLNPIEIAGVLLTFLTLRIIFPAVIVFGIGGLLKKRYQPTL